MNPASSSIILKSKIARLGAHFLSIAVFTLSFSLSISKPVYATASFGQASDLFNVGVGARALGMGNAFTGVADDAAAPYYNPAGLALLDEHQLMAMHAPLFLDTDFNYLASAHPFGDKWGSLALSDVLLLSDGFEIRDTFNNVTNSNGSLSNNAIMASYARKLPFNNLSAGANIKFIQQKIEGFSDSTLGLDAGFLWTPNRLLNAGLFLGNINSPELKLDSEADVIRPVTRFGLASHVYKNRLTLSVDLIKISRQSTLYAAGVEFRPTSLFNLRTGFNENRSYTFGIGVNLKPFSVDYAFSDTDVGAFNKVSVTWAWHNIYKTDIEPPIKEGRAVYPLAGFDNKVKFIPTVPSHVVANWSLKIKNPEGEVVRTLEADLRPPEEIIWNARNEFDEPVVDGAYTYEFDLNYKNGKNWKVSGDLDLALPDHEIDEVIDMNLELNGTLMEEQSYLRDEKNNVLPFSFGQESPLALQAEVRKPEVPDVKEEVDLNSGSAKEATLAPSNNVQPTVDSNAAQEE